MRSHLSPFEINARIQSIPPTLKPTINFRKNSHQQTVIDSFNDKIAKISKSQKNIQKQPSTYFKSVEQHFFKPLTLLKKQSNRMAINFKIVLKENKERNNRSYNNQIIQLKQKKKKQPFFQNRMMVEKIKQRSPKRLNLTGKTIQIEDIIMNSPFFTSRNTRVNPDKLQQRKRKIGKDKY